MTQYGSYSLPFLVSSLACWFQPFHIFFLNAEMRINSGWMIGTGENSKEVDIQNNRIRREKEIIYKTVQEIPPNPKEPWDREMDYDDSLTPEIPTEQLPDVEGTETVVSPRESEEIPVNSAATTSQSSNGNGNRNRNGNGNMAEPDLELLAVLLKNPELVFALTSAEGGGSLSSEDTMKLLDMLKSNGVNSQGSLTGVATKVEEKVEVSLPSPTPSSNPVTVRVLSTYCTTRESYEIVLAIPKSSSSSSSISFYFFLLPNISWPRISK